jgi:hypothetical protein
MGKFFKTSEKKEEAPGNIKETVTDVGVTLGAGAIAGALSGLAVAPLSSVADIAGSNAQDEHSKFYRKSNKEVAKILYNEGRAEAALAGKNKVFGGIKKFYGGQGLKALKIAPQNAINLAIFTGLTGIGAKLMSGKRDKNKQDKNKQDKNKQ